MHSTHSSFADDTEATKERKAQEEGATDDDDGTQGPLPHSSKEARA